jgi:MFS family permease
LVALVQTADTLPDVLLALPAGALADAFDRRRLLIGLQLFQVVVGVGLTVLTIAGQMTPPLLLAFTFALGAGSAMALPPYQALIPELVPREQLASASALGSISVNLARAIGPAVAGLLIAHIGVGAVFALNTATFLLFTVVLVAWRRSAAEALHRPEQFLPALRAGGRYIRYSPVVRRVLLRLSLFVVPATAIWALLPLVANRQLGMGADGYGLLLGALGGGAVAGAVTLPQIQSRLSPNRLILVASVAYAAAMPPLVLLRSPFLVFLALVPAGAAWVVIIASINALLQIFLPAWVRGRGIATFQMVLFGSQAVAAIVWGLIAEQSSLTTAVLVAALVMLAGVTTIRFWPLLDVRGLNRDPTIHWPEPKLAIEPDLDAGPVLVTTTYTIAADREERFLAAMVALRLSRLRTGAIRWELYRDGERPNTFLESYTVPSWEEHLRQHHGRLTGADVAIEQQVNDLSDPPPQVAHLFPAVPSD